MRKKCSNNRGKMFELYVLLLLLAKTQSQSSLVLLGQLKNEELELRCITTQVEKAIVWNTPNKNVFLPAENRDSLNSSEIIPTNWTRRFSLDGAFWPVLDERWEGFSTRFSNSHKGQSLNFVKLFVFDSFFPTHIPISVKLKEEGHIYICTKSNAIPPTNECYWIILGGWNGTRSGLRKCKEGDIDMLSKPPHRDDCIEMRAQNDTNKLNENEWKHFTVILDKKKKSVSVVFEGETTPYLYYKDDNLFETVRDVYVNSRDENRGFWKLHNYDVYLLKDEEKNKEHTIISLPPTENALCLSMYVVICNTCTMELYLKPNNSNKIINPQNYPKTEGSLWQKIKYKAVELDNTQSYMLSLKIAGELRSYDKIILSNVTKYTSKNCFQTEIKYSTLKIKRRNAEKVSCQYLLNDPKPAVQIWGLSVLSENPCKPEAVGSACVSCKSVYNNQKALCENTIVCETERCYCSQGSIGTLCELDCEPNKFGFGCKESCGKCVGPCNNVYGNCSGGCTDNFGGTHCKEAPSVLLEPPQVVTPCITKCEIKFDTEKSNILADAYVLEYKESTQELFKSIGISFINNSVVMDVWRKTTNYTLRINITTKEGNIFKNHATPTINFATTCRNLELKDINITVTSNSAELNQINLHENELCALENYNLTVSQTGHVNKRRFKDRNFIEDLKPMTTYYVTISGKDNKLSTNFTTDEDLPVLLEAPKVILPCYSECIITFNATNYRGVTPYVYKIEYKETHAKNWSSSDFNQFPLLGNGYYIIDVFKKASSYSLRMNLFTINGKSYKGKVKETNFTTSCSEVYNDNIFISATNTSAILQLNVVEEKEICNFENYQLLITNQQYTYRKKLKLNNTITDLEPWVTYNVVVFSDNHNFNTNFTTGESLFQIEQQSNLIYTWFVLLLLIPLTIVYTCMRRKKIRFIKWENWRVTYNSRAEEPYIYDTVVA